jgi:hypothetical protein
MYHVIANSYLEFLDKDHAFGGILDNRIRCRRPEDALARGCRRKGSGRTRSGKRSVADQDARRCAHGLSWECQHRKAVQDNVL